jgi:transcriptional regulator of acetoin/glycerol metabolism
MTHTLHNITVQQQVSGHLSRILEAVQQGITRDTSEVVARSWSRCLNDYHLDPSKPRIPPMLSQREFRDRRERSDDIIECSKLEMTTLYQQLADPECAVVLAGTDGVILHMVSSPTFAEEVEPLGFRVGAIWSEQEAGTNGMGTCLAAATPVAVRQNDHFLSQYTSLTCSAVPVFDQFGEVAAVLDVTSRSRLLQQHSLVLLGMTAQTIENRLLDHRFRDAYPIHFHSRPEFIYTLHEGKLIVQSDGAVLAANRSALFQLGFRSISELRGRRLHEIFQTTLDDVLHRSASSSFHPVAVYRVDASNRFFVVAQQPISLSENTPRPAPNNHSALAHAAHASTQTSGPSFGDPLIAQHMTMAARVLARGIPVLLHGETGSGKEVFASALHAGSPMSSGSFVAVNCASLPETLIESELFGYRAGAFTGAQRTGRRGKILQAHKGTLFLDEIGDMPLALQARLLRVLDERQVTPLGSEETIKVEFQLVSATHRDLTQLVRDGLFREDLYYRLNGIEVALPALRERPDRAALMRSILDEESEGRCRLASDAEAALLRYRWPGNVRQLRHVMRTLAALCDGGVVSVAALPAQITNDVAVSMPAMTALTHVPKASVEAGNDSFVPGLVASGASHAQGSLLSGRTNGHAMPESAPPLNPIQANEREVLLRMLEEHRWNVSNVAKALGISRNTFYRKLHKLHIELTHGNHQRPDD